MAIGKSLRFKIFSQDGFTCRYCGRRPPDVVLEVDHLHPRSKGGTDDEINLLTSCFDCNRGKRDRVIADFSPKPDADLKFLELQQEIAEVNRYLSAKQTRDEAIDRLCYSLQSIWGEHLTDDVPSKMVLLPWIRKYGPDEIETVIHLASPKYMAGQFRGVREFTNLIRYIGAVLRNRQMDGSATHSERVMA